MSIIVRFAPSPTGYLHIGNARAALINWLFARKNKGQFLLRLDDTDSERSKQEYVDGLYQDLDWLGLDHDFFATQSSRLQQYRQAQQFLMDQGRLYPCYETPEELEMKRKIQLEKGQPPVYDRSSFYATQEQKIRWEKEGRKPHWRFRLNDGIISWTDLLKGDMSFNPVLSLSDPVLVKADGSFLYTLSSVVDDLEFGITHIIRGEDHITNTAIQIQLFEALNKKPVAISFAHLSLLFDHNGQPLSKRLNSFCLKNLRAAEIEPMALNCLIASLGSSTSPCVVPYLADLVETFDLTNIKGGARVEELALEAMNRKIIHIMPFEIASTRSTFSLSQPEWELVRESLENFSQHALWQKILHQDCNFKHLIPEEDHTYVQQAWDSFPQEALHEHTWKNWTTALKTKTGRSGKALAHPLRLALTGLEQGPEMQKILPFLSLKIIQKRLQA